MKKANVACLLGHHTMGPRVEGPVGYVSYAKCTQCNCIKMQYVYVSGRMKENLKGEDLRVMGEEDGYYFVTDLNNVTSWCALNKRTWDILSWEEIKRTSSLLKHYTKFEKEYWEKNA